MLVLTRKLREKLLIRDNVTLRVLAVHGNHVRLGFDAPRQTSIKRAELINLDDDDLADPELQERPAEWLTEGLFDAIPC